MNFNQKNPKVMIKKLVNPFENFTDRKLLQISFLGLIVGTLLAFLGNGRFDGLMNFHLFTEVKIWQPFLDILINTAIYSALLFIFGAILNKRTRKIDIYTVCFWSQMPFYLLPVFNIGGKLKRFESELLQALTENPQDLSYLAQDYGMLVLLILVTIFAILALIIFSYWSWIGFKWATNSKNNWHILVLVVIVLISSILSKSIIQSINN
jgi:hypothetical protein